MPSFVRPIQREDAYNVIKMAKVMQAESPAYKDYEFDPNKVHQWVDLCILNKEWHCVLAFIEDEMVGFLAAGCVEMIFSPEKTVDDLALYVLPEHRGTMAAPRMIKHMIQWAKSRGASEMRFGATTGINNSKVTELLKKFGFARTGTLSTLKF